MERDEAERALIAWASIERNELVRDAHLAGVSKNRIHTITGISRPTIDRILEEAMQQPTVDRLVGYLNTFTANWPRTNSVSTSWVVVPLVSMSTSVEQLAQTLLQDAAFKALKLGTALNTPDGQMLAAAVAQLTPPPYREDLELLLAALKLAAQMQHAEARKAVAEGVLLIAGAGAIIALLASAKD